MARRVFPLVWRFNALVIAAVGVLGLFIGCFAAYHVAREIFRKPYAANGIARVDRTGHDPKNARDTPAPIQTDLRPSHFTRIEGTTVLWSPLVATQSYDYGMSSKEASSVRNYVFYDTSTGVSRKLLPDDGQLIFNQTELRPDVAARDIPPLALRFEIVAQDTNSDGILSYEDIAVVYLARPDGTSLTRLEGILGRAIGSSVSENGKTLVLMFDQNDKIAAVHVDLATFQVSKIDAVAR